MSRLQMRQRLRRDEHVSHAMMWLHGFSSVERVERAEHMMHSRVADVAASTAAGFACDCFSLKVKSLEIQRLSKTLV